MDVDGISVAAAEALEGQLIDSVTINEAGRLIFTRKNLETIDAGVVRPPPLVSWPIGSIYFSVNSANPSTFMGAGGYGGTWAPWGAGRVPVGVLGSDPDFNAPEITGGEKAVTLTAAQMPVHGHTGTTAAQNANHTHGGGTDVQGDHQHGVPVKYWTDVSRGGLTVMVSQVGAVPGGAAGNGPVNGMTTVAGGHSHNISTGYEGQVHGHAFTTDNAGSGGAHNNVQPYITCYMWKRLPDPVEP